MGLFCCFGSQDKELSGEGRKPATSHKTQEKTQPEELKHVSLPQTHPDHSFPEYGWTTVFPHPELSESYQVLLEASKCFFALPEAEKETFKTRQGSEDGWNVIEGEKEFITLRSLERTPDEMKDAAAI